MKTEFSCEVCGGGDGQELGARTYSQALLEGHCGEYQQKRLRVLFDTWFPGAQEIRFTAIMCRRCGFVSQLPRVEPSDVHSKYVALLNLGQDYGTGETESDAHLRSELLYNAVTASGFLKTRQRILDFGGGDGRLMRAFAHAGHDTFLVDYNSSPVQWIKKLCNTLDDLPSTTHFDLVIASHVLEHVAEPTNVVRQLAAHIIPGGHLFVEVPLEIWGREPLHDEPVTHVNFFVPGSLQRCLEAAGLDVISCRLARYLCAPETFTLAIQAMGRRSNGRVLPRATGVGEVTRFLTPSLAQKVKRRLMLSGGFGGLVKEAMQRRQRLASGEGKG